MQALAYKAYGDVRSRTQNDGDVERQLFKQITEALEQVSSTPSPDPATWADAISRNMSLWTILATDLLNEANALPDEIRKSLLELSDFVCKASLRVLSGSNEIQDLIDINLSIIGGLETKQSHTAGEGA